MPNPLNKLFMKSRFIGPWVLHAPSPFLKLRKLSEASILLGGVGAVRRKSLFRGYVKEL